MGHFLDYLNNLHPDFKSQLPSDLLIENDYQPSNRNKLTNNKFLFLLGRTPYVSYFCQRANIPSIGFGTSIQSNPTSIEIRRPGTRLVYEDLQISFVVDEEMKNWLEIHNWMTKLGTYEGMADKLPERQKVSDAYLILMNSSYKPQFAIQFLDIYPTFLTGIDFDSTSPDIDVSIASVTFSYTYYKIVTDLVAN